MAWQSLACSNGFSCLPSQPTERAWGGGDSRARATEQPDRGLLAGAAFTVRHSPASEICFISLTLHATANSSLVLPLSRISQRKWRAARLQPKQGSRESTAGISAAAASAARPSHPVPLLLPGKGAQHGHALLSGQRHTGKEEKTLERRTGEADSRSPRWRHSLPFSAKCPAELHGPVWPLSRGLWGSRMHLLQQQVQQRGLLTP